VVVHRRRHRRLRLSDIAAKLAWDTKDLGRLLGVSDRLIDRLVASGRIVQPDLRFSRRRLWRSETIRRWLDQEASK
jgi:hypothetical protein